MLFGDKVRLRALEETDVPTMQRWLNELEGLVSSNSVPHLRSLRELERTLESQPAEAQQMAVETGDGRHIGIVQIKDIDWVNRHADLALITGEADYRSRGFEEDAIRLAAGYAFRVLNLHRLGVVLVGDSERTRKPYEACGFKEEGRRDDYYWAGDRYLDQIQMRLLAYEFRRPQVSNPESE